MLMLTCPSWFAGALGAARGLDVAAAHMGTVSVTGVLECGLTPVSSEARGARAEEAGDQGGTRAGQDCQGGEQGLAAASILAELGILAGVNKLARLPQKTRSTPGLGKGRKLLELTSFLLCLHCFPSLLPSSPLPLLLPPMSFLVPKQNPQTHWHMLCP